MLDIRQPRIYRYTHTFDTSKRDQQLPFCKFNLQMAEDKNKHLAKVKIKLESSLDEIEDALEREKKARVEQERSRRKAEADIKSMQSSIEAVERTKKEMEASAQRREKEIAALTDKLSSEQVGLSKMTKQVKECGVNPTNYEIFDVKVDIFSSNTKIRSGLMILKKNLKVSVDLEPKLTSNAPRLPRNFRSFKIVWKMPEELLQLNWN